jgi:hypothetical protein
MAIDKKEMIEQLKFEIQMIENGVYYPSARNPLQNLNIFRDSTTCLNLGLEEKTHACTNCFLSEFATPEARNSTDDICQKILLNEKGDTIESLKAEGDPHKLQATVLNWLMRTIAILEDEVAAESRLRDRS